MVRNDDPPTPWADPLPEAAQTPAAVPQPLQQPAGWRHRNARPGAESGLVRGRVAVIQDPMREEMQTGSVGLLLLLLVVASIAASYRFWMALLLPVAIILVVIMILTGGRFRGFGIGRFLSIFMMRGRRPAPTYPVQHFRLDTAEGLVQCVMEGDTKGGALHQGDEVEVAGRWISRHGVFRVNKIYNPATGAIMHASLPVRELANRYASYVLRAALAVGVLWIVVYAIRR